MKFIPKPLARLVFLLALVFFVEGVKSASSNFVLEVVPTGGIALTSPTQNLVVSNTVFTITGTSWAASSTAVGQVLYSINGSALAEASTTNQWSNWYARVPLISGTNSVYAQARDTNGVILGEISMVTFKAVLSAVITVYTNGRGTISPQYNQAVLALGKVVSLTAKAAVGCVFTNWTDSDGSIITNKAVFSFVVNTNLVLTANFLDVAKPTLTFTSPTPTTSTSNQNFTASGKASDNLSVGEVRYKLNEDGWEAAATTNGWTNWIANLQLTAGTNVLSVYATDTTGNRSLTNTVRFFYVVTAPLIVRTNGKGSISPSYNNALLRIGQNYTLTATPAVGFGFVNWTDDEAHLVTNKPALLFRMADGLVFTANFVDVSKPVLTITTPTATTSVTNEFFTASGKATDNATVTGVHYQLNGGSWLDAKTTNGWTNWFVVLDLVPGTNSFSVYAEDNSANRSATNFLKFAYATAPTVLNGLVATVQPDGLPPFTVAFGTSTFSQISTDTNNFSGVGNYSFTRSSANVVQLKFTYTAPPTVTNEAPQIINLTFSAPGVARFTNSALADTGSIAFSPAPNLAISSVLSKAVVTIGSTGQGSGTYFLNGKYISLNLNTQATNNGASYSYVVFSRLVALFQLRNNQGVTYLMANYLGTNYGAYYSEVYGTAGNFLSSDYGVFGFTSQRPSGNAPTNIINRSLQVISSGGEFDLSFRTNTFGQASRNTNFDNGVGNYTYARTDTNHADLNLAYTAPPTLSGETNSAHFSFFADNLGIFTNGDGTISAVVLSSVTNSVPDSLGGKSVNLTNDLGGVVQSIQFANDGTFTVSGVNSSSGNYVYSNYSSSVGLVQLTFTGGSQSGDTGWLQLNYQSVGFGNYSSSIYDSGNVLQETAQGGFGHY